MHQDAIVRVLKRSDMTYTPANIGISSNRIKAIVSIAWVVRKASEMSYPSIVINYKDSDE